MAHDDAVKVLESYLDGTQYLSDLRTKLDEIVCGVREALGSHPVEAPTVSRKAWDRAKEDERAITRAYDKALVGGEEMRHFKFALELARQRTRRESLRYHIALAQAENGTNYVLNVLITLGTGCAPLREAAAGPGETFVYADINPGTDIGLITQYFESWQIPYVIESDGDCSGTITVSI